MSLPDTGIRGLIGQPANWLEGKGPCPDVVIASRVQLCRNLSGTLFPSRAAAEAKTTIRETVHDAARQVNFFNNAAYWDSEELPDRDRDVLVERRLASPAWARSAQGGIAVDPSQMVALAINGGDHLRLQSLISGLDLVEAFRMADQIDDQLGTRLAFAFSERSGYLTASPGDAGTGLRASLLLHLPALALNGQLAAAIEKASPQGLAAQGWPGEGGAMPGNLVEVSNRATLGRTELEIIEHVERAGRQIMEQEHQARQTMLQKARPETEDKVWRAHGILRNARVLTADEFLNLSSAVRLGISLGIALHPPPMVLNRLLVLTQRAHLQVYFDQEMDAREFDIRRAELVRGEFSGHSEQSITD